MVEMKLALVGVAAVGAAASAYCYYFYIYLPQQKSTKPGGCTSGEVKEEFLVLKDVSPAPSPAHQPTPPPTPQPVQDDFDDSNQDSGVEPILFQSDPSPKSEVKTEEKADKSETQGYSSLSSAKNEDSMIIVNKEECSDQETDNS